MVEEKNKPPTSHNDSLVVVGAGLGLEEPPTSHNDSLVVVGAGIGGGRATNES